MEEINPKYSDLTKKDFLYPIVEPIEEEKLREKALGATLRGLFSRRNPFAEYRRKYRHARVENRIRNGKSPGIFASLRLLRAIPGPLSILRTNYRSHIHQKMAVAQGKQSSQIESVVRNIANLELKDVDKKVIKSLRSVLNVIEGFDPAKGKRFSNEKDFLLSYHNICTCSSDDRFSDIKVGELTTLFRKAGVTIDELKYQDYQSLLHDRRTALLKISGLSTDGRVLLLPKDMIRLTHSNEPGQKYTLMNLTLPTEREVRVKNEYKRKVDNKPSVKGKRKAVGLKH